MVTVSRFLHHLVQLVGLLLALVGHTARFLGLCLRPPAVLVAENLFLRKQLALYQERHIKPRRATDATRLALVWLARWFDWRQALAVVQPGTFLRWHRQGIPALLALEVHVRSPADPCGPASPHPSYRL
jgi:hypothetical protein